MMDGLLLLLLEELERDKEHELNLRRRAVQRSLRDNSDPFSIPNKSFEALFRFPKHCAQELIARLEPHMQATARSTAVPTFLKFYGKGSYQSCIGQNYSLSQCSVSRSLHEVTASINNTLLTEYIKFPETVEAIQENKIRFMEIFNLPGIVGVMGGTLITILQPPTNDKLYPAHLFVDRNGCHSLNTLIICDANLRILSLNACYPGSVDNAEVWLLSKIKDHLKERYIRTRESCWLIGDHSYPNRPWLLVPMQQARPGTPEERYNRSLCSVRSCMKNCIVVLKGRFGCLMKDRVLHYAPPMAGSIINACVALHNFLVHRNVPWDEPIFEEDESEIEAEDDEEDEISMILEGRKVRARVIRQYFT